jgi:putative membrane protein
MVESGIPGEIPQWAKSFFAEGDSAHVEGAIAEVEALTRGEIIALVVRSSSTIGHVNILVFCSLWLVSLLLQLNLDLAATLGWDPLILQGLGIVGSLAVARILGSFPAVQRLLVSRDDQGEQVQSRAEREFYQLGLHKTKDSTGVLIFASLLEHKVIVLADKSIAEKLTTEVWQEVVNLVISGIKGKSLGEGLTAGIKECGRLLNPHFPVLKGDENELSDALIFKE